MKLKEAKDKLENLSFFISFVEISKIKILQSLNKQNKKLNNIQNLKSSNLNLLKAIEDLWFKKRGISIFERDDSFNKNKKDTYIYFLVDPKKMDIYSKNMLKKMEEKLSKKVTKNDFIVTFGTNVNIIAQKLELNIIEHFDYSSFENVEEFSEKISSLIEIGVKNNLFNKVVLMITQFSNSQNNPIVQKQILPIKEVLLNNNLDLEQENHDFKNIVSNINISKAEWNPDIYIFHEHFSKTVIKQSIFELKILSEIEELNLELQLLEEKKQKILEQKETYKMIYNKVRKEEMTMQSLLLYSAFKIRKENEEFPLVKVKGMGE